MNEAYRLSVFYSPDAMFLTEGADEKTYTKGRVYCDNGKTVIRFNNSTSLSVSSAFGLQLIFEYYCYLMGVRACIDRVFLDMEDWLREMRITPVYAVLFIKICYA